MRIGLILACAGEGKRIGLKKNKVFLLLNKKPIFYYSYLAFSHFSEIKRICIATQKENFSLVKKLLKKEKRLILVEGGKRRQDSVYFSLKRLESEDVDYIIIHDGARPLIRRDKIKELILALKGNPAVILALPFKEAVKLVRKNYILKSLERGNLYLAQTPQGFRKGLILKAYKKFNDKGMFWDDSQLVERLGKKVKIIAGDPFNIKVTYPEDLKLALSFLGRTFF